MNNEQPIPEEIVKWIDDWKRKNIVSAPDDWQTHALKTTWAAAIALDLYRHLAPKLTVEKPAESSKREMLPYLGYGKVPDIEKPKHFWPEDTADLTKSVHLTLASILSEDVDYSEAIVAKAAKLIGLEWAGMMDAVYEGAAEWEQKYNSLKEKYDADLKEACLVHEKAINHMQAQLADKQKRLEQFKIDYKRRIEQINALDRKIAAVYEIIKDDLPLDHNQKPENE